MAWIKEVSKDEDNKLKQIYMKLYEEIMFGESKLSVSDREMIGVVVSKANECPYCVSHHSEALYHVTSNKELMNNVIQDYHNAGLTKKQIQMCEYVEKLTKTPYKIIEDDIGQLREIGFVDESIFDINQVCAYFNYVNRIIHGLGLNLEDL